MKMAHLSSSCGTATFQPASLPNPESPRGQSITTCRRSALVIENDFPLTKYFLRILKEKGFAARTADTADEGLRLYRECGPFTVLLVNYCVPGGVQLAITIREYNPSQRMIIAAFDYRNEEEVIRPRELADAQLLIDICNFQRQLERIKIDREIEQLTKPDLLRLRGSAEFRVRCLGRAACGMTGSDLLSEALRSTLEGTRRNREGRRWNTNVDFVTHLMGAMRSIASSFQRRFDDVFLESEVLVCDIEGHKSSPFNNVPSNEPTADQWLIQMEEEKRITGLFANDPDAILVLRGIFDGAKRGEIMQKYGLIEKQYTAAVKLIRLKLFGRRKV